MNTELKERKQEKFLNKIFSAKNIYNDNEHGIITSAYKQIIFFGIKIKIKIKFSKLENNLINRINYLNNLIKLTTSSYNTQLTWLKYKLGFLLGNEAIQNKLESSNDGDKMLVKKLYQNLDEEAIKNLNRLLQRNTRIIKHTKFFNFNPKASEVYNKDEIKELDKISKFLKEVEVKENYYQWKNFKLPINLFTPTVFLNKYGLNFLKNKAIIKDAIIDVGAAIGDSAIVLRDEFPDNKIICFEPEENNYNLCLETLKLNNSQNIILEKLGLGDKKCSSFINGTGGAAKIKECNGQQVNITTLDDYVKENNIKVGLIKVDIEGFEKKFLEGARETIRTQAPTLLLSIYHSADDFFTIKPMVEEIMQTSPYEYRYDFFQPVYQTSISECLLICEKKL